MDKTFLHNYKTFVDGVTSPVSKTTELLIERIRQLDAAGADPARLMTAGVGLSSEGGEFNEIVKKIVFHGKEFNEDNRFHMKRELGDIVWYWMNACIALNYDPYEIIEENVNKLEARYPGGKFSVWHSENRKEGDL
jgi:NTP pyrophosphatase (non-canonical NTP hydrolase)